jgi:Putative DNA-binding domain
MKPLKEVQEWMMAYIASGEPNPILDCIEPNEKLKTNPLEIYRQSVLGNHLGAFSEIYPVVCQLVGQEFFDYAFVQYQKKEPNQSFDISLYGEGFADFLRNFEPCASLNYLPDVARLEWFCHKACLGAPYPALDFAELAKVPTQKQGQLCFDLPLNSYLCRSKYPILKIWEVNQPGYEGTQVVNLDEGGEALFIFRNNLDLRIDKLNDIEFFCLQHFINKQSLEKMFYVLKRDHEKSEQICQNLLVKMIQRAWLVGFTVLE